MKKYICLRSESGWDSYTKSRVGRDDFHSDITVKTSSINRTELNVRSEVDMQAGAGESKKHWSVHDHSKTKHFLQYLDFCKQ